MSRLVLDAGAFIAVERNDVRALALLRTGQLRGYDLVTTAPVVTQVWRDGRQQVLLARFLRGVNVVAPTDKQARNAGALLRATGTTDVVDALVAELCIDTDVLVTSDAGDLAALLRVANTHAEVFSV
jgi:predicted nucleic acid-binding protein